MFIRSDNKVRAEVLFDNGEIVCFHASWETKQGKAAGNRFTTRSSTSFKENFRAED